MNENTKPLDFSFLYDIDIENDTYTLLYCDHKEVIHGIPLGLLDFIHSGLVNIGCICGKRTLTGGENYGE